MFYVVDEKGNKVEGYDKEGFLAVLQEAIDNGDLESIDADSAFVTKLKCCVGGGTFQVAFVSQATYNTLKANNQLIAGALYFITDDVTEQNLENAIASLQNAINNIDGSGGTLELIVNGTTKISLKDENNESKELNMSTGILKVGTDIISRKRNILSNSVSLTLDSIVDSATLNINTQLEYGAKYIIEGSIKSTTVDYYFETPPFYCNNSTLSSVAYGNVAKIYSYAKSTNQDGTSSSFGGNEFNIYLNSLFVISFANSNRYFPAGTIITVTKIYKIIE